MAKPGALRVKGARVSLDEQVVDSAPIADARARLEAA